MTENPVLESLCARYPLPGGFRLVQSFSDRLVLGELELGMVGLIATRSNDSDGPTAIGSAAEPGQAPWSRAYFELLERASLWLAKERRAGGFTLRNPSTGEAVGQIGHADVFGDLDGHGQTRASLSNGVALYSSCEGAARRARNELAERDGVLAAWWREAPVDPIPMPSNPHLNALEELYDVRAFQLGDGGVLGLPTAGVFAFPRRPDSPLVYGFGAAERIADAANAAAAEALQRLAFLWGEAIPDSAPTASATSDYHQEFFLVPAHAALLREWLAGDAHAAPRPSRPLAPARVAYVDLTPDELVGRLWVLKAMAEGARRLRFGPQPVRGGQKLPTAWHVHPIM